MGHKTVIERVTELEQAFPELVNSVSKHIEQRMTATLQHLDAVMEILGREMVTTKVKELLETRQTQEAEAKKKQLEDLVTEGRLVKTESVSDKCVIVAQEKTKEGKVVHPGRFQLSFNEIAPVFQEQLLGKGAGFVVDIPGNGTLEVQEIFEFTAPPPAAAVVEAVASSV